MTELAQCRGLLGRIFGHKFTKTLYLAGKTVNDGYCYRCGFIPQPGRQP